MRFTSFMTAVLLVFAVGTIAAQDVSFKVKAKGVQIFNTDDAIGRNQVIFYSKAPMEDIFGAAADVSGTILLDPVDVKGSLKGMVTVQARSMTTGLAQRDREMLGEKWLDIAKYPTITFRLKELLYPRMVKKNEMQGTAMGDFTMHGVTRTIMVPLTLTYLEENADTRKRGPGDFLVLRSKFSVKFEDYDIAGNKQLFGIRVAKDIELDINLFASNEPIERDVLTGHTR